MNRSATTAAAILTAVAAACLAPSHCLAQVPIVVFDEDDAIGVGYYDASWGRFGGNSLLTLAGPDGDKLPIDAEHASSGSHGGLLQWTSVPGGRWRVFVSSPEWRTLDASAYDSLTLTVNGPAAIGAANLPEIGLESVTDQRTAAVNLATALPRGLDADPATWQRINIPLKAFQPYGLFVLSEFKDFWFRQGSTADSVQHTIWFDDVRLVGK